MPQISSAEPAPAARALVPAADAPAEMSSLFQDLAAGSKDIAVPEASWQQLQLTNVVLGPSGRLTVTDARGLVA